MNCRAFREHHGDWVDEMVDASTEMAMTEHLDTCGECATFDTRVRRALLVARNAPPIEVSSDFAVRLAARLADERRARIESHAPSHAERTPIWQASQPWLRRAAVAAVVVGGTAMLRGGFGGAASTTGMQASSVVTFDSVAPVASTLPRGNALPVSSLPPAFGGEIVVISAMRPLGGALLPESDDPLLHDATLTEMADASATTVAATAPLWPTAQMAAHAASRFAAMEFGDVIPVAAVQRAR
jgi:hypothetical protein